MSEEFTLKDWAEAKPENFYLQDIYTEQVHPLVEQLEKLCSELDLPFVFYANVAQEEGGCSGVMVSSCCSVARVSPEFIAHRLMMNFNGDSINGIEALLSACQYKFSGE